jgi:hypothetical protein
MSNTKYLRELLETVDVLNPERACERISEALQELRQVEADRAKDAELIQQLVDALEWVAAYDNGCPLPTWEKGYNNAWSIANSARAAAKAAGFKPSDL